ncbi:DUF3431 superfamily domain-containing protein [Histoplasma capsulatum var. duboisii H88]|nr:DUF3431 superfamily domain-containing protein [Histoplasma capsulatum var. duboisii H88]
MRVPKLQPQPEPERLPFVSFLTFCLAFPPRVGFKVSGAVQTLLFQPTPYEVIGSRAHNYFCIYSLSTICTGLLATANVRAFSCDERLRAPFPCAIFPVAHITTIDPAPTSPPDFSFRTMKCNLRIAVSLYCFILAVALLFLVRVLADILDQYSGGLYLIDSIYTRFHSLSLNLPTDSTNPFNVEVGDKIIVMAKLEEEDTDWVQDELPDWQRAIYVVNPSQKTLNDPNALTVPRNKGRESMAYLSYIIDNYDNLPRTIGFLHAHRSGFLQAWHVDAPLHDNVIAMRTLRIAYVQHSGYVNLRCNWNPGCKKEHRINRHVTDEVWMELFSGTSTPPQNRSATTAEGGGRGGTSADTGNGANRSLLQSTDKPTEMAAACCAQFAVSRDQVLKRPVEDYMHFRDWVTATEKNDASSGRVMEYMWHIIFGMDAVFCPDEHLCYCSVYGRCK